MSFNEGLLNDQSFDTELSSYANDSDDGIQQGTLKTFLTRKRGLNVLLMISFIFSLTAEFLFRRASSEIYMRHYRDPLNFILVAACTILFFAVVAVFRSPCPQRSTIKWFAVIACFDSLAFTILIISAAFVSVPVSALLMQGVIPLSMAMSVCMFKRRFRWQHYFGCGLILLAISLTLAFPTETAHESSYHPLQPNTELSTAAAFFWGFVHLSGNIPSALSGVCKEKVLSHPDDTKRATLHMLNAFVALFQCLITLVLSPAVFYIHTAEENKFKQPGFDEQTMSIFENYYYGFRCLFTGQNYFATDNCENTWYMVSLHVLVTTLVNVIALVIIYKGSAVVFFVSSALTVTLTHLVSMADFMGPLRVEPNYMDYIVTVVCVIGLVVYRLKDED